MTPPPEEPTVTTTTLDLTELDLTTVPPPTVTDFHQVLAEAVIGLAAHLGQGHQPGIQALVRAAFERQHMLNAGLTRPAR